MRNPDLLGVVGLCLTLGVWAQMVIIELKGYRIHAWLLQAAVGAGLGGLAARRQSRWWVAIVIFSFLTIAMLVISDWEPFSW